MASRSAWAWLYWWPVRRTHQMLFAEALSQALDTGLEVSDAVRTAAWAVPGRRFRSALGEMATHCRAGFTLANSLSRTGIAVGGELLAALEVGEERGNLPGALTAFARRLGDRPGAWLAAAVARRPEAIRFAAALARLLMDQRLTVGLVRDAGRLAAGDGSAFAKAVGRVADDMRHNGANLSHALAAEPGFFDPLFCALVNAAHGRDQLRAVLARLGEVSNAERKDGIG